MIGGAGYSMTNQSSAASSARASAGGGIGALSFDLSSRGIQKGIPTWAMIAAVVIAGWIAWKKFR